MEEQLLQDGDLEDLFAELNEQDDIKPELDPEMEASQRRYQEIIHKRKNLNIDCEPSDGSISR